MLSVEASRLFVLIGGCQLIVALFLAWVMIGKIHFKDSFPFNKVKSYGNLVKAHIDYLLMSLFLFIFFGVSTLLKVEPHLLPVCLALYGSTVNPLGFLIPAVSPKIAQSSSFSFYRLFLYSGHVATTLGFGWIVLEWMFVI